MSRSDLHAVVDVTATDLESVPLLLIPLGSCEQHGPHLPVDTDTRIAETVAHVVAANDTTASVLVGPTVTITASGEHAGFAGTLSIGTSVFHDVIVEIGRSADWADRVLFVNGHGGNAAPLRDAVALLRGEGRTVDAWHARVPEGDAHAGRTETSLLLAIAPETVRLERAEAGATTPIGELMNDLRRVGVRGVSANGVLGDPAGANEDEGRELLIGLVDDLAEHCSALLAR